MATMSQADLKAIQTNAILDAMRELQRKPPRITIAISYLKLALSPEKNWANHG